MTADRLAVPGPAPDPAPPTVGPEARRFAGPPSSRVRRRRIGPGTAAAWVMLALVLLAAAWPAFLATHAPDTVSLGEPLAGPSRRHLLGTDVLGRDVYSRIVYGARWSVVIGLGSTAIALVAGGLLGMVAATAGRLVGEVVMRVTDVLLAFPGLLLALLVVAVLGPGTVNATVAIGCSAAPGFIRLARGQAAAIRDSSYVRAALMFGHRRATVYLRHLVPNALPPLLVFATVYAGAALIAGSSLSFLGLGPRAPTPEWGAMLAEGRTYVGSAWGLTVYPGVAVALTVICCHVVGRDLRRRFTGMAIDVR
ncbi:ABC transporter permease [Streptomyces sp. NPDC007983]|uniref:ABC transporter permease n=1 Tax=Streptomyces sp. NPDC007983 TaxID=3364800 RepID=UPI0036E22199